MAAAKLAVRRFSRFIPNREPTMPFSFTCPHCQSTTTVADRFAGQSGPCANCGQSVTVGPRPSDVITAENNAAIRMLVPVDRSVWAIAAGYLGLFSPLMLAAPFALVFGILGVRHISKNKELHGMGRAIFGIVMGLLFTLAMLFGIATMIATD